MLNQGGETQPHFNSGNDLNLSLSNSVALYLRLCP